MVLFLIGLVSGIISGMGIGGGAVLIPALVLFVGPEQHVAQSTNLIVFIPTAIVALIVHFRNKQIDYRVAIPITVFGLAGTYIGSRLALAISGPMLRKSFAIFFILMGINEILRKGKIVSKRPL